MADENISVALTDNGTIEEVTSLLELFGVNAEQAAQRAQTAFTNTSKSQESATASAKALSAAQLAGVAAVDTVALAFSKLTTSEQVAATTGDQYVKVVQLLTTAQTEGVSAAVALARAVSDGATAADAAAGAISRQATAIGEALASQEALSAASATTAQQFGRIATAAQDLAGVTTGLNVSERETVAILTQLGVAAGEAAERVSSGFAAAASGGQVFAVQTAALAQAANAGYLQVDELTQAISLLSQSELSSIANTEGMTVIFNSLTEAVAASGSAFAAQAVAVANETGTFSAAANANEALAEAASRLSDFLEADAVSADKASESVGRLASATSGATAAAAALASVTDTDAAAVARLADAEGVASTAAVTFGERVVAVKAAGAELAETFGGLNAIFAGAFALTEVSKASDEFAGLNASLKLVTTSSTEFASVYGQLRAISNELQAPLDSTVKTFVQFREATSNANVSTNDLVKAVGGVEAALKLGGASAQQTTAVLKTFSEILEKSSGSAGRFITQLKTESPVAFALVSQSAKSLNIDLNEFGSTTADAGAKQAALAEKIDQSDLKLKGYTTTVAGAKAAELSHTQAVQDANEAKLRDNQATADATKKNQDLIAILVNLYQTNGEAAKSFQTVGGALTVLKNNLVDFVGSSDAANASVTVLKDIVLLAATNIGTITTAVIAFGSAIAVVKIAGLVSDLYKLGAALTTLALNPTTIEVVAFTAALVLTTVALVSLYNAFAPVSKQIDLVGIISQTATAATNVLGSAFTGLSKNLTDSAIKTQATTDAQKLLAGGLGGTTTAIGSNTTAYGGNASAAVTNKDGTQSLLETHSVLKTNVDTSTKAVASNSDALSTNTDNANKAATATTQAGQAAANSASSWQRLTSAISSAISALANYISEAAQAAAAALNFNGGGGGGNGDEGSAGLGHARDGGTFHVPGGSGVDSRLIAVSPGEVVTVQTPRQYARGEAPPRSPTQTHFATGGVSVGAGVDLGSGVSLAAGAPASAGSSVTGFSDDRSSGVGTLTTAVNDNAATTTANTTATTANTTSAVNTADTSSTAVNSNTTATTANTQSIAGNTAGLSTNNSNVAANSSELVKNASSLASNASIINTAAATIVKSANDNTTAVNNDIAALGVNSAAVNSLADAIASATTNLTDAFNNAVSSLSDAVNTAVTSIQSAAQQPSVVSQTSSDTSSDYSSVSTSTNTGGSGLLLPGTGSVSGTAGQLSDLYKNSGIVVTGDDLIDKINKDADTANQNRIQQIQNSVNAGANANKQSVKGGGTVINQQARDGADFEVPGGSGVDSKVIKLAVSPGETVGVRTPAQRAAAGRSDSGSGQTVVINVQTNDADSFRASGDQIASRAVRGLRRAARRN